MAIEKVNILNHQNQKHKKLWPVKLPDSGLGQSCDPGKIFSAAFTKDQLRLQATDYQTCHRNYYCPVRHRPDGMCFSEQPAAFNQKYYSTRIPYKGREYIQHSFRTIHKTESDFAQINII